MSGKGGGAKVFESAKRSALVLKIEYHREMAFALEEDSTSTSSFLLQPKQHEKVHEKVGEPDLRESLKAAARQHRARLAEYLREFSQLYPNESPEAIFEKNMEWMMDEIHAKAEPMEDPVLEPKVVK
jgi:hypothetical protein